MPKMMSDMRVDYVIFFLGVFVYFYWLEASLKGFFLERFPTLKKKKKISLVIDF